ncbi:MAG: hypothetical protein PHH01_05120 [Patescibacteria group bacterium]|nr:hypothetical protein [Patescibacteria group bacterium]
MKAKGINQVGGIVILLLLAVGGGYGIYATASSLDSASSPTVTFQRNKIKNSNTNSTTYTSEKYGIEIRPPSGWIATEQTVDSAGLVFLSVKLTNQTNDDFATISVMDPELEGLVRNSLSIERESDTLLSGLSAKKLVGGNMKDGSPVTMILAEKGNYLYQITSYTSSDTLDKIIEEITIKK